MKFALAEALGCLDGLASSEGVYRAYITEAG